MAVMGFSFYVSSSWYGICNKRHWFASQNIDRVDAFLDPGLSEDGWMQAIQRLVKKHTKARSP